jgi:hypothetical protein
MAVLPVSLSALTYPVVDTNQKTFFNSRTNVREPKKEDAFYGQDAHFIKNSPSYTLNSDGTVTDNRTGLIWQKSYKVLSYREALATLEKLNLESDDEWRLPTIKELYSLVDFNGVDASSGDMYQVDSKARPFIDTEYFDFEYGSNGDRIIDTQLLSSTIYNGKTMNGDETVFGLNIADGRIKGYPLEMRGKDKKYTVRFVKGNKDYGKNNFIDNKDQTITDEATGLMWSKGDSGIGMNWEEALIWAQEKNKENYLGYSDWRLPDAKELQSIVDYSNSPQFNNQPAIDEIFGTTSIIREDGNKGYASYWTSTTHNGLRGAEAAVYISFGEALGYMSKRGQKENKIILDVHEAGAQRSDPKSGDPSKYPKGRGPQGDVIRIDNIVRLVRNIETVK